MGGTPTIARRQNAHIINMHQIINLFENKYIKRKMTSTTTMTSVEVMVCPVFRKTGRTCKCEWCRSSKWANDGAEFEYYYTEEEEEERMEKQGMSLCNDCGKCNYDCKCEPDYVDSEYANYIDSEHADCNYEDDVPMPEDPNADYCASDFDDDAPLPELEPREEKCGLCGNPRSNWEFDYCMTSAHYLGMSPAEVRHKMEARTKSEAAKKAMKPKHINNM